MKQFSLLIFVYLTFGSNGYTTAWCLILGYLAVESFSSQDENILDLNTKQ